MLRPEEKILYEDEKYKIKAFVGREGKVIGISVEKGGSTIYLVEKDKIQSYEPSLIRRDILGDLLNVLDRLKVPKDFPDRENVEEILKYLRKHLKKVLS